MDSALKDNETKEKNMQEVRDEFGILDGEFTIVNIVAKLLILENIVNLKVLEDDKVINVREAVIEEDEDEDIIDDIANIPVSDVRRIVNTILRKINVDLRVSDYKR